jgi:hypothetical protein
MLSGMGVDSRAGEFLEISYSIVVLSVLISFMKRKFDKWTLKKPRKAKSKTTFSDKFKQEMNETVSPKEKE